jgi:SAM-dependent methyltransferase
MTGAAALRARPGQTAGARPARPYAALARDYDRVLGRRYFQGLRRAFSALVRRFGMGFRSAADLGCGTGLFACHLARRSGVPVLAVDRSPEMLAEAMRNCRDCRVGFLLQDIRDLRLPRPVDLVTANFDTLNHLLTGGELRRVFARVRDSLNPGGHFVFDLLTDRQRPGWRAIAFPPAAERHLRITQSVRWDPRTGLLATRVLVRESGGVPRFERHLERGYDPVRVARWLEAAGFEVRALLDAPTLGHAQGGSSRVIFVARRRDPVPR